MNRSSYVARLRLTAWAHRTILDRRAGGIATIAGAQLWLSLLWFFYGGQGVVRGLIVVGTILGLVALRALPPKPVEPACSKSISKWLRCTAILAVILNVISMADTDIRSWRTGHIPSDEGRTTWNAVRLLDQGENPYGLGAIADFQAYRHRVASRQQTGLAARGSTADREAQLSAYGRTLDPALRDTLLPLPAHLTADQEREAHLSGYKYGPLILLATLPFASLGIPAMVLVLNGVTCFALYAVLWKILRRVGKDDLTLASVGMIALLLDRHIGRDYINRSATDVYSLFFGALGVLAFIAQRHATAAASVACSVGAKIVPGIGFVPLLLCKRPLSSTAIFLLALTVIFGPWLMWDASGIFYNILKWPILMQSSPRSWVHFAPSGIVFGARCAIIAAISLIWLRYLRGRERLFWCLAASNTLLLLGGANFGNNYVPWASIWIVVAIVEAFTAVPGDRPARC